MKTNIQSYEIDKNFRRLIIYTARASGRIICTTTYRPAPGQNRDDRIAAIKGALELAAPKLKFELP